MRCGPGSSSSDFFRSALVFSLSLRTFSLGFWPFRNSQTRIILGARLTVEGAEIRLAVGKMYGPGDACGALGVTGRDFTEGTKLSVISFFVFENAKPRRLGFDFPYGCLELSLRAG